ncbi:hypothetical protein PHLCEN_2v8423 [Hermanssonia centrifuga]|uniref:Uncharacterized protein n=1 Tax=Hermanssonia centrifuga TaxID=98765 RepID=A0A2R6NTS0_9APHY|nr:hypothetical protein PHLCEN_2v8423 [Hermanssonia centrifuga]
MAAQKEAMSLVLNHIRPLDVQNQPISFLSTANLNCSKPASAHPNVKASAGNRRSRRRKEKSKATSPTQDDKPASTGNKHVSQRKLYWRRCIAPRAHRAGAGSN